jgi:phage terminase small subunit
MRLEEEGYLVETEYKNRTEMKPNPLIDVQRSYADEMRKWGKLCGISVDSRLKAATTRTTKKEEDITAKFGGI